MAIITVNNLSKNNLQLLRILNAMNATYQRKMLKHALNL